MNFCAVAVGAALFGTVACTSAGSSEPAPHTLTQTYWKLTSIGDVQVTIYNEREAYIELQGEPSRVGGSDGCNRMMGNYRIKGSKIEFSQMAGTMMACVDGMEQSGAFTKALSLAASWRVDGSTLSLFDSGAKKLLTFEAAVRKSP